MGSRAKILFIYPNAGGARRIPLGISILNMKKNVLNCELPIAKDFALNQVDHSQRITEMEFYFPFESFHQNQLSEVHSSSLM